MAENDRRPVIHGFGSAAIDFRVLTADLGPNYRAKLLAREVAMLGGGAVANALVQVSRLGGSAAFLGKLGTDWIGDRIVADLEGEGVDCGAVIREAGACSPFNLAAYAGEDRRRVGGFLLPNSLATLTSEETARLASVPRKGDIVLIEVGEVPFASCLQVASECRRNDVRVVLDVDLDPVAQCGIAAEDFAVLADASDIIMPNGEAMTTLYPGLAAEALCGRIAKERGRTVIVTAGADGAFYSAPGIDIVHQEAFDAEVVDTVGAGDAFHGGAVFALAAGATIAKAVELGARCGAINCESAGAREGMPDSETVKRAGRNNT